MSCMIEMKRFWHWKTIWSSRNKSTTDFLTAIKNSPKNLTRMPKNLNTKSEKWNWKFEGLTIFSQSYVTMVNLDPFSLEKECCDHCVLMNSRETRDKSCGNHIDYAEKSVGTLRNCSTKVSMTEGGVVHHVASQCSPKSVVTYFWWLSYIFKYLPIGDGKHGKLWPKRISGRDNSTTEWDQKQR